MESSRSDSRPPLSWGRWASTGVLVVVAILWLGPYAWMTLTSLRTLPEIVAAPAYPFPKSFQLGAYREVFEAIPENLPPIVVVQHMLPGFTVAFAGEIRLCSWPVPSYQPDHMTVYFLCHHSKSGGIERRSVLLKDPFAIDHVFKLNHRRSPLRAL